MPFCGNCGSQLSQESGFCGSCGQPVKTLDAVQEPTPYAGGPGIVANGGWSQVAGSPAPPAATPKDAGWTAVSPQAATPPADAPSGQAAAPLPGYSAVAYQPVNPSAAPQTAVGLTSNQAGALCYVLGFITGIIFLVADPYKQDRFVRFHAMQSILYCVACIVFSVAWRIFAIAFFHIFPFTALFLIPIRMFISLGMFLLWLFLIYQAFNKKEFRIPIIGAIAAQQAGS